MLGSIFEYIEWLYDFYFLKRENKDRYYYSMLSKWGRKFIDANPAKFRVWYSRFPVGVWCPFPQNVVEYQPLYFFMKNNPDVRIELNKKAFENCLTMDNRTIYALLWSEDGKTRIMGNGVSISRVVFINNNESDQLMLKVLPD